MQGNLRRTTSFILALAIVIGCMGGIPGIITVGYAEETSTVVNLLKDSNPSFETKNTVSGWTVSDSNSVIVSAEDVAAEGACTLKVIGGGHGALSAAVSSSTGYAYNASVQIKGTAKAVLEIRFYGGDNSLLDSKLAELQSTDTWQVLSVDATAPSGTVSIAMYLGTASEETGNCWFDAAILENTTSKELANPSFEQDEPGAVVGAAEMVATETVDNWTYAVSHGAVISLDALTAEQGVFESNTKAIHITDPDISSAAVMASDRISVKTGHTYVISVDSWAVNGICNFYLVGYSDTVTAGEKITGFEGIVLDATTGAWKTNSYSFTNTSYSEIQVCLATAEADVAEYYVDSFSVLDDTNLLTNGDFETDTVGNMAANWARTQNTETCVAKVVERSEEQEKTTSNQNALHIYDNDTSKAIWVTSSVEVPVEADRTYAFSAESWFVNGNATIYAVGYKNGSTSSSNAATLNLDKTQGAWKNNTLTYTNTGGYATFKYRIATGGSAAGEVFVDKLALKDITKLIANPTFENGAAGEIVAVQAGNTNITKNGWYYQSSGSAVIEIVALTEDYATETHVNAVHLVDQGADSNTTITSSKVPVIPGTNYTASVESWKISAETTDRCFMYLKFYDCSGKEISLSGNSKNCDTTAATWKSNSISFVAPDNAAWAAVAFSTSNGAAGEYYLDNVTLTTDTVYGELKNGSFEADALDNWSKPSGAELSTAQVKSGSQSVKITDTSADSSVFMSSDLIPVLPGRSITVTADTYAVGANCSMYLYFYSENSTSSKVNVPDNSVNCASAENAWATTILTYEVPANVNYAAVVLATSKAASTVETYVDNITFTMSSSVLTNAGFETFATIPHWSSTSYKLITRSTTRAHDGTASLRMGAGKKSVSSAAVTVAPGETYYASVDVYGLAATQLFLRFYDASNTQVGEAYVNTTENTEAWKTVQVSAQAPDNAVTAKVWLATASSATGEAWFDNVTLIEVVPATIILNPDFESDCVGAIAKEWFTSGNGVIMEVRELPEEMASNDNLKALYIEDNVTTGAAYVESNKMTIEGGSNYCAILDTWSVGEPVYIYTRYYDASGTLLSNTSTQCISGVTRWLKTTFETTAPAEATHASLVIATTVSKVGISTYVDNISFMKEGDEGYPENTGGSGTGVTDIPVSTVSPGWEFDASAVHPRTYFNSEELATLKTFSAEETVNGYGFSGKSAYDVLIAEANAYLAETSFTVTMYNDQVVFATDKLVDPNKMTDDEGNIIFSQPPTGYSGAYPRMEFYSDVLKDRMQTLALAYAISGDTRYSTKAIQYLMDMTEWEYWADYYYIIKPTNGSKNTELETFYLVMAAATVFDLCYDQMSVEQRNIARNAIDIKGLAKLYEDIKTLSLFNKDVLRSVAIAFGAVAIADESNAEQMKLYMTKGYHGMKGYLELMCTNGAQEGYYYTGRVLDDMIGAIDALRRFTGNTDLLETEFLSELLTDWVLYFMAPGSGTLPAISDSFSNAYFYSTLSVLSKVHRDGKIGYYLINSGAARNESAFNKLVFTDTNPVVASVESFDEVLTHLDAFGYGALRTGFDNDDLLMTFISNGSAMGHNHYDQNSFAIATQGQWMASDAGYAKNTGGTTAPATQFGFVFGHNVIFVDGYGQMVKGSGEMSTVLDSELYAQLKGSAPSAYGVDVLNKADRNVILVNHEGKPYYIVVDELTSSSNHTYSWNLFSENGERVELDGQLLAIGASGTGNNVTIAKGGYNLYTQFIGNNPLTIKAFNYADAYGPLVQAAAPSGTSAQFMSVIDIAKSDTQYISLLNTIDNNNCTATWNNDAVLGTDVKLVPVGSSQVVFFRAKNNGDAITFPFTVEEVGTYSIDVGVAKHNVYGQYQMYIDGVACGSVYDGYNSVTLNTAHSLGLHTLTAGQHTLKLELVGKNESSGNVLIGVSSISLSSNSGLGSSSISVAETYDDSSVLGAKLTYTTNMDDIILFNRTIGSVTAGDVTTDGEQVSILGLSGDAITEGFAAVGATSLRYKDNMLFAADAATNIVADYTGTTDVYNIVSSTAQTVRLNVGSAEISVTVDGSPITLAVENGVLSLTLTAGSHQVIVVSNTIQN